MKFFKLSLPILVIFSLLLFACISRGNTIKSEPVSSLKPSSSESPVPTNKPIQSNNFLISFKLDVGDKKHSFKVLMETTPIKDNDNDFYSDHLIISIFDENNMSSAYQIMNDLTIGKAIKGFCKVEDVNFDGFLDFYYLDAGPSGKDYSYYNFWVWDPKTKVFLKSKELSGISYPSFDRKNKVVMTIAGPYESYQQRFYKYINRVLTCVRILDKGDPNKNNYQWLTVKDYEDGKLVEVFRKKTILNYKYEDDKFSKWGNINYNG